MNSLDEKLVKELKELAKLAATISDSLPEQYREDAFEILFKKLLQGNFPVNAKQPESTANAVDQESDSSDATTKLAKLCGITTADLQNVISASDDNLELVCTITGEESHKQIVGALVILLAYEILFSQKWIKSTTILEVLKKTGIRDKGRNFSTNMKKQNELILKKPSVQEYMLTTNNGRKIAAKIISKLAKSEKVEKTDLKIDKIES